MSHLKGPSLYPSPVLYCAPRTRVKHPCTINRQNPCKNVQFELPEPKTVALLHLAHIWKGTKARQLWGWSRRVERLAGGVVTDMGKVSLKHKCLLRRHKSVISRSACFLLFFLKYVLLFLGSSLTGYTVRTHW